MRVICSYCRKRIGEKEPFNDNTTSHGMCKECFNYFMEQIKGLSLDKYLDKFETPVLIVNKDCRVVASNEIARNVTGKSQNEVFGLLNGEAMECVYARLPEGCGNVIHCETCAIRNTL